MVYIFLDIFKLLLTGDGTVSSDATVLCTGKRWYLCSSGSRIVKWQ